MASLPWGWLEGQLHAIGEMAIENDLAQRLHQKQRGVAVTQFFSAIVPSRKMVGQPTVVSNTSDSRGHPARL
jgi:hypothetical protein